MNMLKIGCSNFLWLWIHNWKTINAWWLQDDRRKWTSVSFLLDRKGIVRYIHSGGQYVKGDGEYEKLQQEIEKLLNEKM